MVDKRRLFGALLLMVTCFGIMLIRVLWIQRASIHVPTGGGSADLVRQSVLQREERLLLDSGRGDFLDRTGKRLTGETYASLLVFPAGSNGNDDPAEIDRLCALLGTTRKEWTRFRQGLDTPRYWAESGTEGQPVRLTDSMTAELERIRLDGLAVVPYERRYIPPYPAAQLIGYIGQNPGRLKMEFAPMLQEGRLRPDSRIGAAGLEKTFEPLLSGLGGSSVSLFTDAHDRPIPGIGYRLHAPDNPYYPLQVITTLDKDAQMKLEQLADRSGLKDGAIVVLDAHTAELVAMVSRPWYDPERVEPAKDGWSNRGIQEAVPGSIFKTVVAAAALEHHAADPDEWFECKGAWGKYYFTCWKKEGHGRLTFRQAYAQSCNIVFGQIMKRLTPEQLESTARKLGLEQEAGWKGELLRYGSFRQLDGEETGQIWSAEANRQDEGISLQTSIGQRDVRMTPLQAANMVVTLLNGGERQAVRAVREVRYRTGRVLASFPKHMTSEGGKLSGQTAAQLSDWMKDVVRSGTGTALQGAAWDVAGKSGTAQTPVNGTDSYNQWFVGYGPVQAPRYAVSVVSLGQKQSGPEAVILFRRVMDTLAQMDIAAKTTDCE